MEPMGPRPGHPAAGGRAGGRPAAYEIWYLRLESKIDLPAQGQINVVTKLTCPGAYAHAPSLPPGTVPPELSAPVLFQAAGWPLDPDKTNVKSHLLSEEHGGSIMQGHESALCSSSASFAGDTSTER